MNEVLNYNDYLLINECNNIELIYESFSISEKMSKLKELLIKFNNTKSKYIKKIILNTLILLSIGIIGCSVSKMNINTITNHILKNNNTLTYNNLLDSVKNDINKLDTLYKNPLTLNISELGKQHIKEQESLILTAKDIGDGKITIGYGHSEYLKTSKYKIGDTITEEEADMLFEKDLIIRENAIRRMFNDWNKEGINIKITQNMFDVLVSLVYNSGVRKLRNTEFIDLLKNNQIVEAGLKIKDTLNSNKNFPGLVSRRNIESNLFLANI